MRLRSKYVCLSTFISLIIKVTLMGPVNVICYTGLLRFNRSWWDKCFYILYYLMSLIFLLLASIFMMSLCCIFQQSVRFTAPRKRVSLWGSVLPGYYPGNSVRNRNWGKTSANGRACITIENTPRWHVRICSPVRICFLLAPSLGGGGGWGGVVSFTV